MSHKVDRLEKGIYFIEYGEEVSFAEFHDSNTVFAGYAQEDGVSRYVLIVDAGNLRKYPTDIRALQGVIPPELAALMLMNAPKFGEIIARIIANVNRAQKIELIKSIEEGLQKARVIMGQITAES